MIISGIVNLARSCSSCPKYVTSTKPKIYGTRTKTTGGIKLIKKTEKIYTRIDSRKTGIKLIM
jgi:hypothetical protein